MKTKTTSSSFPQAARLLLIASATLASSLFSLATTKAQDAHHVHYHHLKYKIPTDAHLVIKDSETINSSLTVDTLSFDANSTLFVDGTLTIKNISCDVLDAKMILCPDAIVDLEGSTLIASSLTLADGTEIINGTFSFNDGDNVSPVPADRLDTIPSYELSNGAKLIHGTLIIDSTQANAVHLVENNEHSNPAPGTITYRPQN
ncbi:MAG: hypothetical protein FJ390_06495 [Verrucomicrobia bacterium]|nr:hypothetical protein [Verrucomicrobiota bacterium]